jgi:two-component system chemotaxis response regulator CheY
MTREKVGAEGEASRVKTCLVVDESQAVRKVARRLLETLDFAVAEAADGVEALAWCRAMMPDVVLLDAGSSLLNGLEFLRRLRLEPGGRAPKVIFCSAETDLDRIRQALDAGVAEYIIKPFDGDIVAEKLALAGLA